MLGFSILVSMVFSIVACVLILDNVYNGIPVHSIFFKQRRTCTFKEAVIYTYDGLFKSKNVFGYMLGTLLILMTIPGIILAGVIRVLHELIWRIWDLGYYERWKKCQKEKQ